MAGQSLGGMMTAVVATGLNENKNRQKRQFGEFPSAFNSWGKRSVKNLKKR